MSLRPDWEVQLLPGNIEEAVEWFGQHLHPDILFLDIQLTDGNSFLFIEQAHPESMIVFTTAYDEYAVRAFSVNSIDYLLKPIHEDRLMQTIQRFEGLTKNYIHDFNQESRMLEILQQLSAAQEYRGTSGRIYPDEDASEVRQKQVFCGYSGTDPSAFERLPAKRLRRRRYTTVEK